MPHLCLPCVNIVLPHSWRWFRTIGLLVVPFAGSVLLAVYQLLWPFEVFYPMGLIALLFLSNLCRVILLAVHHQWTCIFEAFFILRGVCCTAVVLSVPCAGSVGLLFSIHG